MFIDIACKQQSYQREPICGDTFLSRRQQAGRKCVMVLSDGMGHGVKANVLSTLSATLSVYDDHGIDDIPQMARNIISTLPVCSKRKVSYSTFTIVSVDIESGNAVVVEFDNPRCMIYRGTKPLELEREETIVERENYRPQSIYQTKFNIKSGDRIVVMSDGVSHSGQGSDKYPFGWGEENINKFILNKIRHNSNILSTELAREVISQAVKNDGGLTNDDISCAVLTLRKPRKALIVSCLPENKEKYHRLIDSIYNFDGKRAICGQREATLISQLVGEEPVKDSMSEDEEIPPMWHLPNIDIVSEGLATLNKVYSIFNSDEFPYENNGAANQIIAMLSESDEIHFLIGNATESTGDIYFFDEFNVKRDIIRNLRNVLENKYLKSIKVEYI